ncbi:MAG: TorF family putative porin, partial [Gammaproteobacteria bacterium]
MKKLVLAVSAFAAVLWSAAAAAGVSATVTATTDYVFRGITQSAEDPALQGSLDYEADSGFYVGAWASNVDFDDCCDESVTQEDKEKVKTLLNMLGICEEVDEKYMDAITALSGSGPGYLSIIIEALMYAGLKVGLPRNIALTSSAQTVLGTGKLVIELQEHPAKIKDMVTTPGGTTIEAIY